MAIFCISDIHLGKTLTQRHALLAYCLEKIAPTCAHLYIIGDLFDYWIGDDIDCKQHHHAIEILQQSGIPISVMVGNRDFLLGEQFSLASNTELITDPHIITVNQTRIVLTHGDNLLTSDIEYQKFRTLVRAPAWQQTFLAKHIDEREKIAQQLRARSEAENSQKDSALFAIDKNAAATLAQQHNATVLIHGHIHRKEQEQLADGIIRYAMRDWQNTSAEGMIIDDDGDISYVPFIMAKYQ